METPQATNIIKFLALKDNLFKGQGRTRIDKKTSKRWRKKLKRFKKFKLIKRPISFQLFNQEFAYNNPRNYLKLKSTSLASSGPTGPTGRGLGKRTRLPLVIAAQTYRANTSHHAAGPNSNSMPPLPSRLITTPWALSPDKGVKVRQLF